MEPNQTPTQPISTVSSIRKIITPIFITIGVVFVVYASLVIYGQYTNKKTNLTPAEMEKLVNDFSGTITNPVSVENREKAVEDFTKQIATSSAPTADERAAAIENFSNSIKPE